MQEETISLKSDKRGRVTIPSRVRERLNVEDEQAWFRITIHGLDPEEHPKKSSPVAGGDS